MDMILNSFYKWLLSITTMVSSCIAEVNVLDILVAIAMFDHKFVFQYFSNNLNKS